MIEATLEHRRRQQARGTAYIRLVVSPAAAATWGSIPDKCTQSPTIVIICAYHCAVPGRNSTRKGISLVDRQRPAHSSMESLDPRIKSLNYLNNILGEDRRQEGRCARGDHAQYTQGTVAECTADNIFMVKNGDGQAPRT